MRYFYKVYVDRIRDPKHPLIKDIGIDNWATLSVLLSYMNQDNECWPTIETVSHLLDLNPQTAMKRLHQLAEVEYMDKPVIMLDKFKVNGRGNWRNKYKFVGDFASIFVHDNSK